MTSSDRQTLRRLLGVRDDDRASTDDLQGLLLQVVLALLMIFMIAYFLFVDEQKKERVEEVMALNRQKLTLALEQVAEEHRVRYGLNALMTQGIDGKRTFEPDEHVEAGELKLAPAAHAAFASGGRAALADYAQATELAAAWRAAACEHAGLAEAELSAEEREWFEGAVVAAVEQLRLDVRGVQRSLAARVLREWVAHPSTLSATADAGELSDLLKVKALKVVSEAMGAEVLP